MDKKEETRQSDLDGLLAAAVICEPILKSAYEKARGIVVERFGDDDALVIDENWHVVAGQLTGGDPWRIHNAVSVLCCLEDFWDCIAEGGEERLADAFAYVFAIGHSTAYVELEADTAIGVDGVFARHRSYLEKCGLGGTNAAKLTDNEWDIVKLYIEARVRDGKASAAQACREASAQLKAGTFPGVARIPVGVNTLQKRWSKRSKPR